jgi:hypothetical protein
MHRSGTSFAASLLHAAGLDMGSRLMPAARGNERGHFENMDFVEFHMRELRLTGHDDSGWTAMHTLTLPAEAASEAREIIGTNARDSAWGWKDPRTTLFLDFWSSVVSDANYLFIYREPSEVIDSLYRRGDESILLSPELAARAYLTHNEMMLQHARQHRERSFIANVSAIALDQRRFLEALAERFNVDLDANAPSTFESDLMRTIELDAPQATVLRHLVPEIDRLYNGLEREADLPSTIPERKRTSSRKVKEAFFKGWLSESKREDELKLRNSELGQRNADVEQRDAELQSMRAVLYELQAGYAKRGEHLDEAERLLAVERASYRAEMRSLRDEVERAENRVRDAFAQNAYLRATIADYDVIIADLRTTIAGLQATTADLHTTIADLHTTVADLEAQREDARSQRQDLEQRLEQTAAELATQTEALIAATRAESDRVAFLIATVHSSSFWKLKRSINRALRSLGLRAQP